MNFDNIIDILFKLCIIPILGILTKWFVCFIQEKINEASAKTDNELTQKYYSMLSETITNCVMATNQTYVEALKKEGKFDLAAQKIAFAKTKDAVMSILDVEVINYLSTIISDFDTYVNEQIEAKVNIYKNN